MQIGYLSKGFDLVGLRDRIVSDQEGHRIGRAGQRCCIFSRHSPHRRHRVKGPAFDVQGPDCSSMRMVPGIRDFFLGQVDGIDKIERAFFDQLARTQA